MNYTIDSNRHKLEVSPNYISSANIIEESGIYKIIDLEDNLWLVIPVKEHLNLFPMTRINNAN